MVTGGTLNGQDVTDDGNDLRAHQGGVDQAIIVGHGLHMTGGNGAYLGTAKVVFAGLVVGVAVAREECQIDVPEDVPLEQHLRAVTRMGGFVQVLKHIVVDVCCTLYRQPPLRPFAPGCQGEANRDRSGARGCAI